MDDSNDRTKPFAAALLVQFFIYCIQSLLLSAVFSALDGSPHRGFIFKLASMITTVCVFLIPIFLYCRLCKLNPSALLHPLRLQRSESNRALASRLPLPLRALFSSCILLNAVNLAGMLTDKLARLLGYTSSGSLPSDIPTLALYFISSVICAPILEELLFRGAALNAVTGNGHAIFISALTFALMHYSAYSFFYAFVAGAIIAYYAKKEGSVPFAIGLHTINNLLTFILAAISDRSEDIYTAVSGITLTITLPLAVIGIALELPTLISTAKSKRANTRKTTAPTVLPLELLIYIVFAAALTVISALP